MKIFQMPVFIEWLRPRQIRMQKRKTPLSGAFAGFTALSFLSRGIPKLFAALWPKFYVDNLGLEPRISRCKRDVFPLALIARVRFSYDWIRTRITANRDAEQDLNLHLSALEALALPLCYLHVKCLASSTCTVHVPSTDCYGLPPCDEYGI
jgi:hypothetical protein